MAEATWAEIEGLRAENGRLDLVIDELVDETKVLKAALRSIAGHEDAPDDHCHQIAAEALQRVEAMQEAAA